MNLLQQALGVNNLGYAQTLLNRQRPQLGQPDLRDWEWRYLWSQTRADEHEVLFTGTNPLTALSFSADGRLLVWADGDKTVVADLVSRRRVLQRTNAILPVFAHNSARLAFVNHDSSTNDVITLLDTVTQKDFRFETSWQRTRWLGFTPDDRQLVSMSVRTGAKAMNEAPSELTVWESDTGRQLWQRTNGIPLPCFGRPCAISPDGKAIAVILLGSRVQVLETKDGSERFSIKPSKTSSTYVVMFSPDSSTLLTGGGYLDPTIRLWDARNGSPEGSLEGHALWVSDLIFTPDGKRLISSSGDQTIRLWDWSSRKPAGVLRGHLDELYGMALGPDGQTLASRCKDGSIYLWNLAKLPRHFGYQTLPSRLNLSSAVFTPDSRTILGVEPGGGVALWDAATLKETRRLWSDCTNRKINISPDAKWVMQSDSDGHLRVWDVRNDSETTNFNAAPGASDIGFTDNGKFLVTLSGPDTNIILQVWDTGTWHWQGSLALHFNNVTGVFAVSMPNSYVIDADGALHFFDVARLNEAPKQIESPGNLNGLAVSPDGRMAAWAYNQEITFRLWDMATLHPLETLKGFQPTASSIAFSPDGRRLATGSGGREAVNLWDAETRQEVLTLIGERELSVLKFSPDGRYLLGIDPHGIAYLWLAPTLTEIEATEGAGKQGQPP
jgi:WD40 repeat protein